MNNRPRRAALASSLVAAVAAGCSNPFLTGDDDYGPYLAPARVRSIDSLNLDSYTGPPQEAVTEKPIGEQKPPDPFEGLERVELTIEQVRAFTLSNNLDLQVALFQPTIAEQVLDEEEAKFEAVFFANIRQTATDRPTSTELVGTQADQTEFDTGVRIPLRTGGTVTVELPASRLSTNNTFSTLNPSYTTDLRFSISQPLLRNAGEQTNTYSIRIAAIQSDVEQARTKLEVIRQIAAADRAYWRLYALRQALDVAQQQYELALTQLEQARRFVAAGRSAQIEVTRAEAGLAARLESIITAQNDVFNSQRDLKRVMNAPGLGLATKIVLIPKTPPAPMPFELKGAELVGLALANRMELLQLELQLVADESTIAFQRNQALPLFTLDYAYTINGLGSSVTDSLSVARSNDFADWSVGLSAEIPIGNDAAKARVQQAVLTRLQRLSTRNARRLAIEQETLNAVDNIDAGWQRILAARQSTILAGRELDAERRQFEVGARTSTDVLDAATRLANAQLSEIRALTEYQISEVDLAFATGTLLGAAKVTWAPLDPRDKPKPQSEYMKEQLGY